MEGQLLSRLEKAEKRIVDLYKKLESSPTVTTYSRNVVTLPVPALDDNVVVNITSLDTVIVFQGDLTDNFNFNVVPSINTSIGDRIYLMIKGDNSKTITTGNILNPVQCGDNDTTIDIEAYMVCYEMVYDGEKFTGIDNC